MSEPFQPHPRFAVPILEAEIEQLRKALGGAHDQIMYLTAIINHQEAEHAATVASLQLTRTVHDVMTNGEQPPEQDELGGGAG